MIWLHFGLVEFLVKGLVSCVLERVRRIISLRGSVSGIPKYKFWSYRSFERTWAMFLDMINDFNGGIL